MSGNINGAIKTAAKRIGINEEDYRSNLTAGLKWCSLAKHWLSRLEFAKNKNEADGLQGGCRLCMNSRQNKKRIRKGRPKLCNLRTPTRSGDKRQANARVQRLIDAGVLPKAQSVPCFDCGHVGTDRRHHYDHYLGYSIEHHEHVQAVCALCHYKRGVARGEIILIETRRAIASRTTHCPHGHIYFGKNLYIAKDGSRKCRACTRIRASERWRKS